MEEYLCSCLMRPYEIPVIEKWTMKEYKVQSSWTTTSYHPSLGLIYPICFTKNGEILASNGNRALVSISNKGEHTRGWCRTVICMVNGKLIILQHTSPFWGLKY
ncbi:hypothetical protein JHK87_014729 [Glycine soja]|nr:hypothetical protein JHK87_014729 [Glycine soja]